MCVIQGLENGSAFETKSLDYICKRLKMSVQEQTSLHDVFSNIKHNFELENIFKDRSMYCIFGKVTADQNTAKLSEVFDCFASLILFDPEL